MSPYQELWWRQASSDFDVFERLRRAGVRHCHTLHYLQMVTEKISKAYLWRSGSPPSRSHAGFVQFMRFLGHTPPAARERIANLFSFRRFDDFQNWIRAAQPIAYELERLAPALADDGPNPEYPWPHAQPQWAPALFEFPIWNEITSSNGRQWLGFVRLAVEKFPQYAGI